MRFFYDCEFSEIATQWGYVFDLVSVGIVADDGRELYLINADMDVGRLHRNTWLTDNVWPHLPLREHQRGQTCRCRWGHLDRDHPAVRSHPQIARAVSAFLRETGDPVELWADHAAHDHVVLTGLWGGMQGLPAGIPMWTHDLQHEIERARAVDELPVQDPAGLHNALADARHCRDVFQALPIVTTAGLP